MANWTLIWPAQCHIFTGLFVFTSYEGNISLARQIENVEIEYMFLSMRRMHACMRVKRCEWVSVWESGIYSENHEAIYHWFARPKNWAHFIPIQPLLI